MPRKKITTRKSVRLRRRLSAKARVAHVSSRKDLAPFATFLAGIALFSFFSVASAQGLLMQQVPQCSGFLDCSSSFFKSLWGTLTGQSIQYSAAAPGDMPSSRSSVLPITPPPGGAAALQGGGKSLIFQPEAGDNVGIGFSSPTAGSVFPAYKIDVVGDIRASGNLIFNGLCFSDIADCKSNWDEIGAWKKVSGTNDIYYDKGKVGIGVGRGPSAQVDIQGAKKGSGTVSINPAHNTAKGIKGSVTKFLSEIVAGDSIIVDKGPWGHETYKIESIQSDEYLTVERAVNNFNNFSYYIVHDDFFKISRGPIPILLINKDGNVGIGTFDPKERLHISSIDKDGNAYNSISIGSTPFAGKLGSTELNFVGYGLQGDGAYIDYSRNNKRQLIFRSIETGNTGFEQAGSHQNVMTLSHDNKVGIGTDAPGASLQIAKMGNVLTRPCLADINNSRSTKDIELETNVSAIKFGDDPGPGCYDTAYISYGVGSKGGEHTVLRIANGNDGPGAISDDIALMTTGGVGIGFDRPEFKLDVLGDINVRDSAPDGSRTSLNKDRQIALANERIGFDMAELYDTEESVEVGDVLVVGSKERKLRKSSEPYEHAIVGVVSGAPAILFEGSQLKMGTSQKGSDSERKPAVALAGKVPVKVSLENGLINVGDYLTTSSKSGIAMKATRPGMTIGVALEAYNGNGKNEVLTFLSIKEANTSEEIQKLLNRMDKIEKTVKKK